ncbi:HigA family addiction module antitoxin [Oleidesulfovibrio alaskensis]|jgi:addiction module HigA family antidote|uniref:HigA family addiction module antitoxin n=1 Tax=Oleidesulfovibrio alaskensis TaxID=58180 RepID=UPI000428A15D|nr:HigA family addiction module antitoxin [Oleidesulfovibrio alaskensis]MBL3582640.1 HigA family addiction module antidote protein [Oleidesulfovibrio alaskensis]
MRIKTHPGEVLREEFMVPMKLSASKLSGYLGVPLSRITEIVNEKRGVTVDTAVRLAKFFGTSSEFWINLQTQHDLSKVRSEKQPEIQRIPTCKEVSACF